MQTTLNELWMGTGESEVADYFKAAIFRQPMAKHTVPSTESELKVSTPAPDILYGYNRQAGKQHSPSNKPN